MLLATPPTLSVEGRCGRPPPPLPPDEAPGGKPGNDMVRGVRARAAVRRAGSALHWQASIPRPKIRTEGLFPLLQASQPALRPPAHGVRL